MPSDQSTPRATDDLETAERKSKTIDERVPDHEDTNDPAEIELPGAIMRGGPMETDDLGPGELVLEEEAKAQRSKTVRG
jgi:hypothetical protein